MALNLQVFSLLLCFLFESALGKSAQTKLSYIISPKTVGVELVCTISNTIEICQESVPRTKKIPHCVVKIEVGEEKILYGCFYCLEIQLSGNSVSHGRMALENCAQSLD